MPVKHGQRRGPGGEAPHALRSAKKQPRDVCAPPPRVALLLPAQPERFGRSTRESDCPHCSHAHAHYQFSTCLFTLFSSNAEQAGL
jgi:hypothetical protein